MKQFTEKNFIADLAFKTLEHYGVQKNSIFFKIGKCSEVKGIQVKASYKELVEELKYRCQDHQKYAQGLLEEKVLKLHCLAVKFAIQK